MNRVTEEKLQILCVVLLLLLLKGQLHFLPPAVLVPQRSAYSFVVLQLASHYCTRFPVLFLWLHIPSVSLFALSVLQPSGLGKDIVN